MTANLVPANESVRTEKPVTSLLAAQDAIDLGGSRELFVDNLLVKELHGDFTPAYKSSTKTFWR